MMTEEQKRKAEIALSASLYADFEKKIAFNNYLTAIEWIELYNLPYRVSLDYLKGYNKENGFVLINPCYPFPGYNVNDLIHLKPDEVTPHDPSKKPNKDGSYDLCLTPINAETRQQIKEHNKKLRPWDLSTAAGLKQWEYYFAHFLNGADLNALDTFSLFGTKEAPKGATDKINYWKALQADYHMHTDKYMQDEPLLAAYDLEEYTILEFAIDWDNKQPGQQDL